MFKAALLAAAAALTLSSSACAAGAQTPPPGIVWYVLNQINDFSFDIDDPTNRPPLVTRVPRGVLVPVDISHDGKTDWLINWPQEVQFCGTGGCRRTLYVSNPSGFMRAFDRQAGDIDIRRVDGEVRIESSFHHLYCDDRREDCRLAWGWNPTAERFEPRPSSDGEHVISLSVGPTVERVVEGEEWVAPDNLPDVLAERRQAGAKVCPGHTETYHPNISEIPDLNGDGLPDWVIEAPATCSDTETPPYAFQVWVTRGGRDEVTMAWQAPPDHSIAFDVATRPATAQDQVGCEYGKPCSGTPMRWDEASRTLRP